MNTSPALELDGVTKTFAAGKTRITALKNITLTIKAGQICGLIGPDGAGKSTLMRLATGLLLPDNGDLQALGIDIVQHPLQVQSSVGYMPQRFGLYEDLSVQENLDLYADLHGVEMQQRTVRYKELMRMTALEPFTKRLAGHLSGGMKQKLGLACTLLGTPRLLLLDEPTAGVDPVSRYELWTIINRMVHEEGVSVILSTAYLDEAERCDDIVLLHEGGVLDQGTPRYFSDSMRNRSYHIHSLSLSRRNLLSRLHKVPDIIDASIDNEKIRVVTHEANTLELNNTFTDIDDLIIEPVAATFEDAFIARLIKQQAVIHQSLTVQDRKTISDETVIEVNNVKKCFGDFYAVRGISFNVRRGEIFGLLGANGAGKSTTFRMLCGLLPATSGELTVADRDLRRAAASARSRLGYMAQRFSLYANLTIQENLNFFASAYGLDRVQRKERIAWALETFELSDYINNSSGDLPLGYKQRLALAAALLHKPDILFLDEPTSGVDPIARREFWNRINVLAESGVTVLVTTHFMAEADNCDRLVVMAEGEMLAQGTPAELKARFRNEKLPSPSMEDAFIGLIQTREQGKEDAA
ncbi:MAG: ATP-binding cassette domain-containing protein [Gammaproteobacteria bacterium]